MPFINIFKNKKPVAADSASRAIAKREEEDLSSSPSITKGTLTKEAVVADEKEKSKRRVEEKKTEEKKEVRFGQSYKILKGPHITEKAGDLTEKNQYVFKIFPRANKIGVKKAIEDTYGIDVVSVKIINVPEKKIKLGKIQGTRPGYKKAIVKIKKGQKIEVLPR
ncbi:MAG: 50S ribosomal protein L23 [Candidatus Nealsonbacteria bacterium]|nr:50S ribosomal protein L23 [Candidatus Nealsonbacteria bacterium]